MAKYYYSTTGNNSTGNGSLATPWQTMNGSPGAAQDYFSPGDEILFERGKFWNGSLNYLLFINSSGTANNPIIVGAYGFGADPIFCQGVITTGWTLHSGTIWRKSGLFSGAQTVGVDGTSALCRYGGSNTTLPPGSWVNTAGTIYIHLWDSSDPNNHTIYIPTGYQYIQGRGNVKSGGRDYPYSNGRGDYVHFYNIQCWYANGVGMSSSNTGVEFHECTVMGSGQDGLLFYRDVGTGGTNEDGEYSKAYDCEIAYCVANGGGTGSGQGFTTYAPYTWIINSHVHHNFMAGIDFLDFGTRPGELGTSVIESGAIYNSVHHNGLSQTNPSYDPNIYVDGGHDILIYGNICWGVGLGTGNAGNARASIRIGTEDDTKVTERVYVINNLSFGNNYLAFEGATTTGTSNLKDIYIINNTFVSSDTVGSPRRNWSAQHRDTTANNWHVKNNIFIGDDSAGLSGNVPTGNYLDIDYNLYYRRSQSSSATLYTTGGVNYNLAAWKALAFGYDVHSSYGNPLVVLDSQTAFDAHLQRLSLGESGDSPAIDAGLVSPYTPPAWIATAGVLTGNGAVQGSTRSDGVADNVTVSMDLGFHYYVPTPTGNLTSTSVTPASLVLSTIGTASVAFTTENNWPSTGKLVITWPTSLSGGFSFNSGGTTGASFASGGSGSLAVSIAGNVMTLTRSGGSDIAGGNSLSIDITFVQNPPSIGSTGVFQLATTNSDLTQIDVDTVVPAVTIAPSNPYKTITLSGVTMSKVTITPA